MYTVIYFDGSVWGEVESPDEVAHLPADEFKIIPSEELEVAIAELDYEDGYFKLS